MWMHKRDEAEIAALLAQWRCAVRARDVDAIMSLYAPEIVAFDLIRPLQHVGADTYRQFVEHMFAEWRGAVICDMRDVEIRACGDLALARALVHIRASSHAGAPIDNWLCWTAGLSKQHGEWKFTHLHVSVPFDMSTGKAELHLQPNV